MTLLVNTLGEMGTQYLDVYDDFLLSQINMILLYLK